MMNKIERLIIKSVYIPIIGLIIALFLINTKYYDKILQERYAVIWMMFFHIAVSEIIIILILIFK